jgi:enterochelin esterase-like enzyme
LRRMSLTGRPLLVLLVILAVGSPVATLVLWTRLRPKSLAVVVRAVMVVGCQLAAVMLVAVLANNYGNFYGSWSDLVAGGSQTVGISPVPGSAGNSPATAGSLTAKPFPRYSSQAQWPIKGRIDSVTIRGANSGLRSHAYVFLPPRYFRSAFAHSRFPAAEVFTGYPGTDLNLVERLKYQDVLLRQIRKRKARPMVLVMLRPSVTFPRDTECTDVPAGPQALTFFAQDVTSQISRHYRVKSTGWGAIGDSTGGYCSAKLAMMYPAVFPAAVALSGYYNSLQDQTTGDLWGGSQVVRNLNSLDWRLQHQPAPAVSLLVTTGTDEKGTEGYRNTLEFLKLVKPPMTVSKLVQPHGGHNFAAWSAELPTSMNWLSARLHAANTQ